MEIKKKYVYIGISLFSILATVILTITLLSLTANRKVDQKEIVVPYDTYKMKFYGEKEQGTYTTGVGVKWFTFQRNLQDLGLKKVECLSQDKIEIDLEVRVQIVMNKTTLKKIVLKQFGTPEEHKSFLQYMCRAVIIATCLNYTAEQYYSERSNVDQSMFSELKKVINFQPFGAKVEYFQLVTITLPDTLVQVITQKQNIEQNLITAQNDRQNELITARTAYLEAQQNSQIILLNANKTANIIYNQAKQQENIIATEWSNRGVAYRTIVDELKLNEAEFLEYLNTEIMRQAPKVIV
mmetsp:Transcript_23371/g.24022  ORF Transcript_23371/g.24022 Transcript_23371/m.24022 type:complete len:296 (-) Transcript_23371:69-956(-)